MARPLILDFDNSVKSLPETDVIPLGDRQESIRFGCPMPVLHSLEKELTPALEARPPVVFMGSGDYHHVSYVLISRLRVLGTRIQVVVFDNHPDNMRYPFGIHCGSWVWHVSRLPFVARVHVLGITSSDVEGWHVWENHLGPLGSGKVAYWCVQRNLRAMEYLGIHTSYTFPSIEVLLDRFCMALKGWPEPVYLSIDKDVLAPDVVRTNWDQGVMRFEELTSAIQMLQGRLVFSDVVGDVSPYRYRSRFKRFLSGLDGQPAISDKTLGEWQAQHQQINLQLLSQLAGGKYVGQD